MRAQIGKDFYKIVKIGKNLTKIEKNCANIWIIGKNRHLVGTNICIGDEKKWQDIAKIRNKNQSNYQKKNR
jgi:hypothetical protein